VIGPSVALEPPDAAAAAEADAADAPGWIDSLLLATAIALLVLLPIEIMSWLIVSDPATHTSAWVADRWSSAWWRAVDWVFLVVALVHGALSATRWLNAGTGTGRRVVGEILAAVCVALLVLATYTLFTFDVT
jgi:succinate dehydrogenase hydrophobic anchor subunit